MHIFLSIIAALIYTFGAYFMRLSNGFAHPRPAVLVFVLFCLGATVQMFAMRQREMSGIYIICLGFEAVTASLVGALLLGEVMTWQKIVGALIVCAGVALLRQ